MFLNIGNKCGNYSNGLQNKYQINLVLGEIPCNATAFSEKTPYELFHILLLIKLIIVAMSSHKWIMSM